MTILYPTPAPVKAARRFGAGILPTAPHYHAPYTAADAAWWAAQSNARDIDAIADEMAAESAAVARLEAGYCC